MIDMSLKAQFKRKVLEPAAWFLLKKAVFLWVNNFMDQWEKFKFVNDFGHTTYVTISYHDEYPNSFDDLDDPGSQFRDPPDLDKMAHT